jgi:hypothetical protein
MGNSEKVHIFWVPAEGSDSKFLGFVIAEFPEGKECTFLVSVLIGNILPVFEI